jgi:predicted Zn-dependent peptidase
MSGGGSAPAVPAAEPVVRAVLPNGMTLIVRENAAAPVVALNLFVRVGSRHETPETNGVTALLGRVLLKGTRTRSALELAQAAEDAGGVIESATDQEYSELRARGLAREWPTLLGILHEAATAPRLHPDEIERERAILLGQIRGFEDQPFQVANRLLSRALFGTHPYGLPTSGDLASVSRLGLEDLARHFAAGFTPDRMVLAVSGGIPSRRVVEEAARLFGPLAAGAPGAPLPAPPTHRQTPRVHEIRETEQAHVLVGFLAPPVGHADHVPLKVLNTLLGSGMSSRLFQALREEAGLAYAVGSFYLTRQEAGRVIVHIGTAPANAGRAETGMLVEVARLGEEPTPGEELERAKAFLAGALALDLRTNARQAFHAGFYEVLGVGHAYVGRYPGLIEAVGPGDVRRVARRYLIEPAVAVVGPS